ncbi:YihY/virulence factor BrkB family protein [Lactovum miscens]|uniref:Membrane protein n=1 Tax=Lactovum miscens TaxID=190387 RepID=A0A841C631_9LACT|nr:YihY/virulence factor BrkB family protein [Lactovum miscens]MBB5887208.1 membrane protein [Lactovum miscens]
MKKFFYKISHSDRLNLFISLFMNSEMSLSSIAVAYYLLLSIFPILLLVANVLPYLHIDVNEVLSFMKNNLPTEFYNMTASYVKQYLSTPNTALFAVAIILALWTFSKSMTALQMAMNKAYGVTKHRDFIISRVLGIIGGLIIMILLYAAVVISTFGQTVLTQVYKSWQFNSQIYDFLKNLTLPILALITFIVLVILYSLMPNIRIKKFRYVLPGTFFSVFVLVFLTSFVGQYVSHFIKSWEDFRLVSSIVIFALMIWFIFISRVLIIGAMLNAVYQKDKEGKIETRRGDIISLIRDFRNETQGENFKK